MTAPAVWRSERKFRLSPLQYAKAARWCRQIMRPDSYAKPNGDYFIRSVYLDSMNNGDFLDKETGSLSRKKIRIRTYAEDPDVLRLERKNKWGIFNRKERVALTLPEAEALLTGDSDFLLYKGTDAALRFYAELKIHLYRPVVVVEYEREAYLLPFEDIRITFDKAIRYSISDFKISGRKTMIPLLPNGESILEIKYNSEFPRWVASQLGSIDEVQVAASKFGLSLIDWRPEV